MELIQYLKSDTGFDRMLRSMYDMYTYHERAFGAVRLTRPTAREEDALSRFFKRDYYNQALIRIGLADFERQVRRNFPSESTPLGDILAKYMGKPTAKKPKENSFSAAVLAELPKYVNTPAEAWLKEVSSHTRRKYRRLAEQFITGPEAALKLIRETAAALNKLPAGDKPVPLPSFTVPQKQLFLKALACKFGVPTPVSAEDGIRLCLRAGYLSNAMISNVTVLGLSVPGFSDNTGQARVFTLENLTQIENICAYGNKAYIIEDAQIFAALCESLRGTQCTIVCPVGGVSAAFMYLLKLFTDAKIPLYYAGNMDAKGLELADRLYLEFGKNFIPWRYSHEDYAKILSGGGIFLSDEKRNLSMHNDTLASLLSLMRKKGKTASSMPLVPDFTEDIKNTVQ